MENKPKKQQPTTVHAMMSEVLGKITELEKTIGALRVENSMLHNRVVHMSKLLEDRQEHSRQFYPNQQSSYPETKFNNYIPPAYQPYPAPMANLRDKFNQSQCLPRQQGFFTGQHSFAKLDIFVITGMLLADNPELLLHDFEIELNGTMDELYIVVDTTAGRTQTPKSSGEKLLRFMSLTHGVDFHNLILYVIQKNVFPLNKGLLIITYQSLLNVLMYGGPTQSRSYEHIQSTGRF